MERDMQFNQVIKNMEKRIEREIRGQMKLELITRIANATATLNELREVVKATTEQSGNSLQEQVKTAEREEEERKWLQFKILSDYCNNHSFCCYLNNFSLVYNIHIYIKTITGVREREGKYIAQIPYPGLTI